MKKLSFVLAVLLLFGVGPIGNAYAYLGASGGIGAPGFSGPSGEIGGPGPSYNSMGNAGDLGGTESSNSMGAGEGMGTGPSDMTSPSGTGLQSDYGGYSPGSQSGSGFNSRY